MSGWEDFLRTYEYEMIAAAVGAIVVFLLANIILSVVTVVVIIAVVVFLLCGGAGLVEGFFIRRRRKRRRGVDPMLDDFDAGFDPMAERKPQTKKKVVRKSKSGPGKWKGDEGFSLLELGEPSETDVTATAITQAPVRDTPSDSMEGRSRQLHVPGVPRSKAQDRSRLLGSGSDTHSPNDEMFMANGEIGSLSLSKTRSKMSLKKQASSAGQSDRSQMNAQFYLRSTPFVLVEPLADIGKRGLKSFFIVQHDDGTQLCMSMVPIGKDCIMPFGEKGGRKFFLSLLQSMAHTFVYSTMLFDYISDLKIAVVFRKFCSAGSLKDVIYRTDPRQTYAKKYSRGGSVPIPLQAVRKLGKQILLGLHHLKSGGLSYKGHLHSGNVMIEDGMARLTDYEIPFLNLPLSSPAVLDANVDVDVRSFGYILFEMVSGHEMTKFDTSYLAATIDPDCIRILKLIFEPQDVAVTIEMLLGDPFFRDCRVDFEADPKAFRSFEAKMKKCDDILEVVSAHRESVASNMSETPSETRTRREPATSSGSAPVPPPPPPASRAPVAPPAPAPPAAPAAPPPPSASSKASSELNSKVQSSEVSGNSRDNLLAAIRKGKTLKKT